MTDTTAIALARAVSRVVLRAPAAADAPAFLAAVRGSRRLHRPWVQPPQTRADFLQYLERMGAPGQHAFLVCRRDDGALVGVVNLTNVILGAFRSGYLGYYAFSGHEGQGLMREGLQAVVRHAFRTLKLHRVEANIQPTNGPSLALVRACGFACEGYSPRYLKIAGRWRDHERWALLAD
ncbi:MAG: GNAT family N-acetyltransferase [Ramlibacter sp.]